MFQAQIPDRLPHPVESDQTSVVCSAFASSFILMIASAKSGREERPDASTCWITFVRPYILPQAHQYEQFPVDFLSSVRSLFLR